MSSVVLISLVLGLVPQARPLAASAMTRRGIGEALVAFAGIALLPLAAPAPARAAASEELSEIGVLGQQAIVLRDAARTKGPRAAGAIVRGLEMTLEPLQSKMLSAGKGEAAQTQAQLLQGHILELKQALSTSDFDEYVSKRTAKTYMGGMVERELEEVTDTFFEFMRLMGAKIVPAASAAEPPVWDGRYFDPNHPRGYREVSLDGSTLTIVGRDEPNGLKWTLKAITFGSTANIDFTPKGGPKDLPAKLQAGMIIFPDGNNWTKLSKWDGRYADANHPQGYRDVSVRGNVLTIVGRDDKASAEWKVLATVNGDSASIDFSPKGGPKDLGAKLQDGKIVFPDGNAWPKIE